MNSTITRQAVEALENATICARRPNDPLEELQFAGTMAAVSQAVTAERAEGEARDQAEALQSIADTLRLMARMYAQSCETASKQAADVRAIRECLETLVDAMAAEVQP